MSEKRLSVEDRLGLVNFVIDEEPHIVLREEFCKNCETKVCLRICPAKLYTEENGKINFNYEGCLECGTCRIACGKLIWNYPKGGFGVNYQFG